MLMFKTSELKKAPVYFNIKNEVSAACMACLLLTEKDKILLLRKLE